MRDSITDVPGIRVGNAQNQDKARGCTVVLCENARTAGVDVRGGSPGTRETDLLNPVNMVQAPHAIYLSGGSAFGLAGADGVMQYLSENGIGFHLLNLVVPIVSGAVIFDLTVGDPSAYPGPAMGREACMNASQEVSMGNVGAGTGALIGWAGNLNQRMKGGLGTASTSRGNLVVGAIVVVNCMGNVYDPETGELLGGTLDPTGSYILDGYEEMKNKQDALSLQADPEGLTTHTTIGVVATNAILSKPMATRMAMMAHDGYARSINPSHTSGDGDTIFSIATGEVESNIDIVGSMAAEAMARAIAKAIRYADSAYGYKSYSELSKSL